MQDASESLAKKNVDSAHPTAMNFSLMLLNISNIMYSTFEHILIYVVSFTIFQFTLRELNLIMSLINSRVV